MFLHVKPATTSKAKGKDKPIQRTKKTKKSISHNEHEVTEVETIVVKKSKSVRRSSSGGEKIVFTDDEDDAVHSDADDDRDEIEDSEAGPSASRGSRAVEPLEDNHDGLSKRCFRRLTSLRDHVSARFQNPSGTPSPMSNLGLRSFENRTPRCPTSLTTSYGNWHCVLHQVRSIQVLAQYRSSNKLSTDLSKFIAIAKAYFDNGEECNRLWKSYGKQFLNVCVGTLTGKGGLTPSSSTGQR